MTNLLVSEQEITEIGEVFKKLDASHDGFLTIDELKSGLSGPLAGFKYA